MDLHMVGPAVQDESRKERSLTDPAQEAGVFHGSLANWYRNGHDTLLDARRELLYDDDLQPSDWSIGLRAINSAEIYVLQQLHLAMMEECMSVADYLKRVRHG